MRQLLCKLIASAPECHISGDPMSEWYQSQHLYQQAENTEKLLWILLHQYNSAVCPQSIIYERLDRLHDKAMRRKHRRAVTTSVAMYRSMKKLPSADHVFYAEIVAALQMEAVRNRTTR